MSRAEIWDIWWVVVCEVCLLGDGLPVGSDLVLLVQSCSRSLFWVVLGDWQWKMSRKVLCRTYSGSIVIGCLYCNRSVNCSLRVVSLKLGGLDFVNERMNEPLHARECTGNC